MAVTLLPPLLQTREAIFAKEQSIFGATQQSSLIYKPNNITCYSLTNFQVASGSYSLMLSAIFVVPVPRFF